MKMHGPKNKKTKILYSRKIKKIVLLQTFCIIRTNNIASSHRLFDKVQMEIFKLHVIVLDDIFRNALCFTVYGI